MAPKLFFSHRLDALAGQLIEEIESDPIDPLKIRTILVPNGQVRQWLLLKIAEKKGIAMGLKVMEIEQLLPPSVNSMEMFCLIYAALSECSDPSLVSYLQGKKKRILDLTGELSGLFFKYGQYEVALFEKKAPGWQQELLHKLFVEGPWRLPVQQKMAIGDEVICFGIDSLPPIFWEFLFASPAISIYQFSPCIDYWEDICSDFERKNLNRYWKKRGAAKAGREQLDAYLREAPKNLANWGKLGRETLKIFDRFNFESFEAYPPLEVTTALTQIQYDLLTFQETKQLKIDDSIKLLLTGSSKLKEIEALRDEVLRLDIPYQEISVLAPDIEPYVPLIEYVFSNEVPYRISGFDVASQSPFRQGLIRLLHLGAGRWEAEEILALFETPSFYKKHQWDQERLETIRSWIQAADIGWGLDLRHRKSVLSETLGHKSYEDYGSWEKGLDWLLDTIVYLRPMHINPDQFEELITVFMALKGLDFKGEKTLSDWAECLERGAQEFLFCDLNDEADQAVQNSFQRLLRDLRNFSEEKLFPVDVIQHLLSRPVKAQIHSSHLHAVRFASLDEAAAIPARALFLIGMDEESFPRIQSSSSLDLLRGKTPDSATQDRYLFLQAIFSASEFLRISYGHLSSDEGKPVGPSLLVQELLSTTGPEIATIYRSPPVEGKKKSLIWPKSPKSSLPDGEITVSISDLRLLARHPWKFYLQKVHGIYLDDDLEDSFALQKGLLVRATLGKPSEQVLSENKLPPGMFGKALQLEILERASDWQTQLEEWQLKPFSLLLRQNCTEPHWEGANYIASPLEFPFENGIVRVVGEVKLASLKGLISPNEDNLGGTLKVWPEALAAACALESPQIWLLRNGKTKEIAAPRDSLKAFIDYYFHCLNAPSPLLSDWADSILRKGAAELEKKMEKGSQFEDPVIDWVFSRAEISTAEEIYQNWSPLLKEKFSNLTALYPARGSYAEI